MSEKSLDETLSGIIDKVAGALEKATTSHGPQAVELALEVGRMAAIRDVVSGFVGAVGFGVLVLWLYRRLTVHIGDHDDFFDSNPILVIGGGITLILAGMICIINISELTKIHAWVGMFHPEVYLAYRAIF